MKFEYIQPKDLKEATTQNAKDWQDKLFFAGGTDLLGLIKSGIENPKQIVNLKHLLGLNEIKFKAGNGVEIGALVSVAQLATNKQIQQKYLALQQAAKSVASPQLRNVGTVGGNICQRPRCWYYRGEFDCLRKGGDICFAVGGENKYHCVVGGDPCFIVHPSDLAVALSVFDAQLEIYSKGDTRQIALKDFFILPEDDVLRENILKPGEIVTRIFIPEIAKNVKSIYLKARVRESWDFATVSVALKAEIQRNKINEAKIVLGGVAPKPWHEDKFSNKVKGLKRESAKFKSILPLLLENAEPMEQNGYKVILTRNLVEQAFSEI